MTDKRYWAIVPAAGLGKRVGADIPKQYLPLAGRKLIEHTLERLVSYTAIQRTFVAIAPNDIWWAETAYAKHDVVSTVKGGDERCHSVLNALNYLEAHIEIGRHDWVLVHDAARPCIRHDDISQLINSAKDENGVLLGMPVRDTMKRTAENGQIKNTVNRQNMWHAFTPQMFPVLGLKQALTQALEQNYLVTDEASAMEFAGFSPLMVEGHADNIKVTHPTDVPLAEFFLSQQQPL